MKDLPHVVFVDKGDLKNHGRGGRITSVDDEIASLVHGGLHVEGRGEVLDLGDIDLVIDEGLVGDE